MLARSTWQPWLFRQGLAALSAAAAVAALGRPQRHQGSPPGSGGAQESNQGIRAGATPPPRCQMWKSVEVSLWTTAGVSIQFGIYKHLKSVSTLFVMILPTDCPPLQRSQHTLSIKLQYNKSSAIHNLKNDRGRLEGETGIKQKKKKV